MIIVDLNKLELTELWGQNNPKMHTRSTFPLGGPLGTKNSAMVYFELDPGDVLGRHTDSVEEVILVLSGKAEAQIGDETAVLEAGQVALIPEMALHDFRNIGEETVRVVGFFGAPSWVFTFDEAFEPGGFKTVDVGELLAQAVAVG